MLLSNASRRSSSSETPKRDNWAICSLPILSVTRTCYSCQIILADSWKDEMCMLGLKFMSLMRSLLVVAISFRVTGCGRNQRMDRLYAERCLGCHGSFGRGDGPAAVSLPARLPDCRETVQRKSTGEISR